MRYVLFVCTHNAGRSQMAQAFFERRAPADVRAESAGSSPRREGILPNVVEAMREVGIDLGDRRPRRLDVEMQLHADWAVTLACGESCPYVPTIVEDWDVPDPAGLSLAETRTIRDAIEARVDELVAHRLDAIRAERTAHELRLQALLPGLVDELGSRYAPQEIRTCADAVLGEFADAAIRRHVLTLAHRKARECLLTGGCRATSA